MRKVILSINLTLDGFMAGPNGELDWHFPHWNHEMATYAYDQLSAADTILAGRVTYQKMADHWPVAARDPYSNRQDLAFARLMNSLPKIVFSRTLSKVTWQHSRLMKENIREAIMQLKQQPGKDMIMYGGVTIAAAFIQMELIDEYRIWVNPVAIGSGTPLFENVEQHLALQLIDTTPFSNGVVLLRYRPVLPDISAPRFNWDQSNLFQ
ncbi:dihydrofolate reductase family protein [Chitinophaga nivalis]|uniref:Dihydrofolate reductase family protein n=1 Tax=Chitinophaga nivalis TaxID=2991709 RepID=A0ABT3IQ88_9BACT|nr:dihydrofolate reductase family protein [Chitinophaga nivalis]MCW3464168.1 dihydrofolate reductase family protein [Chitinophaga nivalis]MCW3486142.1 dihydrofolate reductase family protein [Chitinophaga nivalis]